MKNSTKKTAILGIITSVALILAYLEALLPPLMASEPGVKMGLPNLVIIFVFYMVLNQIDTQIIKKFQKNF